MKALKALSSWIRNQIRPTFATMYVQEEPPEQPKNKVLYIVLEDELPWSAAMLCPCGCGEMLHLNLLPDERPRWIHQHGQNQLSSLEPSVHRIKGCRSHFWFRKGKVYWTTDQANPLLKDIKLLLR